MCTAGLDGKQSSYVNFRMPTRALMLLDAIKSGPNDAGDEDGEPSRRTCTFDDVKKASAELGLQSHPDAVRYLLGIFAGLGAVSWFPDLDPNLVVTNPQWLIDSMGCIIREHHDRHSDLLDHLKQDKHAIPLFKQSMVTQGRFPVALLDYIWSSDKKEYMALRARPIEIKALKRILQEFGLIFRVSMKTSVSGAAEEYYLVPALLAKPPTDSCPDTRINALLQGCAGAEKCMCRVDFSDSRWLPPYLFERFVGAILVLRIVKKLVVARGVVYIHAGNAGLLLSLDETSWCINAKTVSYVACPHASRWMLRLLQEAMGKVLPAPLRREAFYKISLRTQNDGDVELSQLYSDEYFAFTTETKLVPATPLKEKWLGVSKDCRFDCCQKQVTSNLQL